MKFRRLLPVLVIFLCSLATLPAQIVWTGLGVSGDISLPGNWRGNAAPANNGTADLYLGDSINNKLVLPGNYAIDAIGVGSDQEYLITAATPYTLSLTLGVFAVDDDYNKLDFSSKISLGISSSAAFDVRQSTFIISGHITGTGNVVFYSSTNGTGNGAFIFNNTGTGNTYIGNTVVGDGNHSVGVAFWNSSPFGTGSVDFLTGSTSAVSLYIHGTQTLANALTFTGLGQVGFRSWDAPFTISGASTLASATSLLAYVATHALPAADQTGGVLIPGLWSRNPIVFAGGIGETGGAQGLTLSGAGIFLLNGTNTYTGGTFVNGNAIFGSAASVPTTGAITVNGGGYVGFADNSAGALASFLSGHKVTNTSTGSIGVDTLPGNSTATFADAIDLSTYYSTSLRIGTATSAILTGTITPQAATPYRFGNGGGTLYVQSNLTAAAGFSLGGNSNLPLTVYLQGSNSYTGATSVNNGFLIFDSTNALSASTPSIVASGNATNVGASYVGYTDAATTLTPSTFLAKFNAGSTWGIIGFDTHAGNSTVSVSNVNLTGFNDGVFIGTTTSANFDASTFTGTTVANGSNAASTLRFTAAQNGVLNVNGNIGGGVSVMIGTPTPGGTYSSGTVVMNGSSTYTGGTTLNALISNSITLSLGNNSALGTGVLKVVGANGGGGLAGIQAASGGINLANSINLNPYSVGMGAPELMFTGTNAFTLSGSITGDMSSSLVLYNASPLTVSLAGDNSGFLGTLNVFNGTLNLLHNFAAGLGDIYFGSNSTATVAFGGAATAPVIYGLDGDSGTLSVPGGTSLTIDISDDANHNSDFGGIITGGGSLTVTAPSAGSPKALFLYGNNSYTGGTTVLNNAVFALGSNAAAGTGAVTVNAPSGGLVLDSGVTFTNPLTFTAGTLGGWGTFNAGSLTFGTGRAVSPGISAFIGSHSGASIGTLTIANNVTFANGGTYVWGLQDITRPDGLSLLAISGNLDITATAGGFNLKIVTFDATNALGNANFTLGTPYSIPILTFTGTITGFNPSAFTIDASSFQSGMLSPTVFTLSQSGNSIYLNFTPVPEPSTFALLGLGLSALVLPRFRRRR